LDHSTVIATTNGADSERAETYESERLALRVNIANLRKKIKENPANPRYIMTEIGIGYKMSEN
jgi:DNA-binding response OmpR family regulator